MNPKHLAEQTIPQHQLDAFFAGNCSDAYNLFGCHYRQSLGGWQFTLWAPHARAVSVVGDFNGWNPSAHPMTSVGSGIWTVLVPEAYGGNVYKYRIIGPDGGAVEKADPYAIHCETGPRTGSKVWLRETLPWNDREYMTQRKQRNPFESPMSIYEVHLGSWKLPWDGSLPNFRQLGHLLAEYCTDMGYTHVELMPVTEFPYDPSWGYQVTGYFAPTSRYGTPEDFADLVNTLHQAGIGVLMDWVPAHFPKDLHGLGRFDGAALYENQHPMMAEHPDWGTYIFDYANGAVRSFLISSAAWFLDRFHIDGIRVDAVSSMLYLDFGRQPGQWIPNRDGGNINYDAVFFLQRLNEELHRLFPDTLVIAEESTAFPKLTEPVALGGLGFDFKWNMGFMHDTLDYMALDPVYRKYHHGQIKQSMSYAFSEKYILPYSHDEVVYGKGSMPNKMSGDYYQKFHSLRTLLGFMFAHPGKKLLFMGIDIGQFDEWNFKSQLQWNLLEYSMHSGLQAYVRCLNQLYTATPALYEIERSWSGFTWLNDVDADSSALAFLRTAKDSSKLVVTCNFTPVRQDFFQIGLPGAGELTPILNSDDSGFGGIGVQIGSRCPARREPFCGQPWSARVSLPPMSCVYYSYDTKEISET